MTGPGDIASGAVGWWSLRGYTAALSSPGTLKSIQVRRSSDSATTDIVILNGGSLDTASAATFAAGATLFVSKIYDQINSNHALQATTSKQPTISGIVTTFDGSSDQLTTGSDVSVLKVTTDCSVVAWVNIAIMGAEQEFAMYDNGEAAFTTAYLLQVIPSNQLGVNMQNGSSNDALAGAATVSTGQHFAAFVHTGGNTQLYLDGNPDGTNRAQRDPHYASPSAGVGLTLGAYQDAAFNAAWLNGSLSEVGIYSRALSAAEISALFNLGPPTAQVQSDALSGCESASLALTGVGQRTIWWRPN